tara:strand:- start:58 stop:966 length:909 start_codon:yes stop_codon:yes gene_type:complete
MKNNISDVLSWEEFEKETLNEKNFPPKKIELFNRLIASTDNFFVIAAIGAFVKGYVMIISKKLIPSLALIESNQKSELDWLITNLSETIKKKYEKEISIFEHGMCACIGGLDRAHLHLMPVTKNLNDELFLDAINKVLKNRRAGISSVEFRGHKLENIHDITQIMDTSGGENYKVNGKQLYYKDIKNLSVENWPFSAQKLVLKGGHYVFFKISSSNVSFLTDQNFQTQLGRQIVFEIEKKTSPEMQKLYEKIKKKNFYANIWRWQEFSFNENIFSTIDDLIDPLQDLSSKNNKFNFNVSKRR